MFKWTFTFDKLKKNQKQICLMQDFEGESQPQNPEFKINPENFQPYYVLLICLFEVLHPSQQLWSCRNGQLT